MEREREQGHQEQRINFLQERPVGMHEFEVDQGPNQLHGHLSDTAVAAVHGHYHQFDTAVEIGALPLFQGITIGATVESVDLITGEDATTTHVTLCDVSGRERGAVEITILPEALVEAGVGVQSEGDHIHCHDPLAIAGGEALALSDMGVVSQSEDPQPEALGSQCLLPRM